MDSKIRVLFFSLLQSIVGEEEVEYPIPSEAFTIRELLEAMFAKYDGLASWEGKLLIAVNCEYADPDTLVKSGDEVAIMPPVQGG